MKPPCWNGKVVQYKEFVISDISILINIDKINYIASQHDGDCRTDTLQNVLMFADGLRDINATFAKKLFKEHPKDLLYSTTTNEASKRIGTLITDHYKSETIEYNILKFLIGTFRRYILIKLAENNISDQDIDKYINAPLPSSGSDTLIKSKVTPPLGRNPSINGVAGPYLRWRADHCFNINNRNEDEFDKFLKSLFKLDKLTIVKEYTKQNVNQLIAVSTRLSYWKNNIETAHRIGIIRNNNKYYIIDNEIGIAKEISNIDKYDGNNLTLEFNGTSRIYKFGEDIILKTSRTENKDAPVKLFINSNIFKRFFYLNEG